MRKVIRRHIRRRTDGLDLAADVNAVIAVNQGDSRAEAVQSTSVTQDAAARAQSGGRKTEADHRDDTREEDT